jgi:two-component system OmpR family response regulator
VRILLLEDDAATASALEKGLTLQHHQVSVAPTTGRALELVEDRSFDVAILDIGLPDGSGYQVLELLRARYPATQVLMLTARGAVDDRVEGLDRGADDYLVKPCSFAELSARLRALERRPKWATAEAAGGALVLDLMLRTASVNEQPVDLTPTEFALLAELVRARGSILTRRDLLRGVWGYEFDPGTNVVDVHVNRLRRKLEERGLDDAVQTVRGQGYGIC